MNDRERRQLFLRAYDMTGYGLSDYLQDFFDDDRIRATQHGEKAYYEFTPRYTGGWSSAHGVTGGMKSVTTSTVS